MQNIWKAVLAGLIATAVLSVLMLMKQAMNLMPQLDMIGMISGIMGTSRSVAWLIHFMVGILYGLAFIWLFVPFLWVGKYWLTGLVMGAAGWLLAMVMMMPLAGNGFFGLGIGAMAPVMALVMHLFFGAVLGWVYGLLSAAPRRA